MSSPPSCSIADATNARKRLAVGGVGRRPDHGALCAELLNGRGDLVGVAGADRHRRSFGQQRFDDGPADALGSPGDECLLPSKSEVHVQLL